MYFFSTCCDSESELKIDRSNLSSGLYFLCCRKILELPAPKLTFSTDTLLDFFTLVSSL